MKNLNDTPRTDALMVGGCIAINVLEHARTLERELNNASHAPVWPEIVRLQGKIALLKQQRDKAVKIAEAFWNNQKQAVTVYHEELADALAALKESIK